MEKQFASFVALLFLALCWNVNPIFAQNSNVFIAEEGRDTVNAYTAEKFPFELAATLKVGTQAEKVISLTPEDTTRNAVKGDMMYGTDSLNFVLAKKGDVMTLQAFSPETEDPQLILELLAPDFQEWDKQKVNEVTGVAYVEGVAQKATMTFRPSVGAGWNIQTGSAKFNSIANRLSFNTTTGLFFLNGGGNRMSLSYLDPSTGYTFSLNQERVLPQDSGTFKNFYGTVDLNPAPATDLLLGLGYSPTAEMATVFAGYRMPIGNWALRTSGHFTFAKRDSLALLVDPDLSNRFFQFRGETVVEIPALNRLFGKKLNTGQNNIFAGVEYGIGNGGITATVGANLNISTVNSQEIPAYDPMDPLAPVAPLTLDVETAKSNAVDAAKEKGEGWLKSGWKWAKGLFSKKSDCDDENRVIPCDLPTTYTRLNINVNSALDLPKGRTLNVESVATISNVDGLVTYRLELEGDFAYAIMLQINTDGSGFIYKYGNTKFPINLALKGYAPGRSYVQGQYARDTAQIFSEEGSFTLQ